MKSLSRSSSSSETQADAHLRRPRRGHVRVVRDDVHAERRQPLGDQDADRGRGRRCRRSSRRARHRSTCCAATHPHERGVRRRDVAGGGQQQPDGQLGGADDVRRRRVDDHHAGLGGRLDVDVVQPDAGAGDHPEVRAAAITSASTCGRAADEQRVARRRRRQQRRPVGAVAVSDLEVGPERVDGGRRELLGDQDDGLSHGTGTLFVSYVGRAGRDSGPGPAEFIPPSHRRTSRYPRLSQA